MRPRWHKILSDFGSHSIRSLLVIASIAVGLFAIGMIASGYVILDEDIRSGYRKVNAANIQITSTMFDNDFVDHIRHMPGISGAEGAWNTSLQIRTSGGEWKPISIKAQVYSEPIENAINRPRLLEGTWPPKNKELVLDINHQADLRVSLGDEVEIKLPSGTVRRMRIVGMVKDQTIGATGREGGFFLADLQGYVTTETLPWLEQPEGFNSLLATVDQNKEDRDAIRLIGDSLVEEFDHSGLLVLGSVIRGSSDHPNVVYVDAIIAVFYVLGFLVVFLSGFLIINTFSALLNQQVQQIGIMKTIGASRNQVVFLYVVLILIYSLVALAIAIPLSNIANFALLDYLAEKINFELAGFRRVPAAILLQTVIALVIPQLAGSLPISQGTRISVREALSGTGKTAGEIGGFLARILKRFRSLSRPILISLRNTFRKRLRLILTVITLTLGGATFIATLNVRESIADYIERLRHYFLADVNLTLSEPIRTDRVIRDVLQVSGVERVEGWAGAQASLVLPGGKIGESVTLIAPPIESTLIEPLLLQGRWLQPGDQNAITLSEIFLEAVPGIKVGDSLRLKIGTKEMDWIVVGFFQFAGRSSGLLAYTNYDTLARELGSLGRSASYRIVARAKDLTLEEQKILAQRVQDHLTPLGYEIDDLGTGRDIQASTSEGLNILTTTLLIMSFLLAAVGSIGLMGTMSLNVMERTQEIGVMRAIGASNRAIISIVLVEGMIIGLISWVLSCFVTIPLSKELADIMFQIIFDRDASLTLTVTGPLIWLGVVLVLSILASVIPAYNASRLTIREVLAYE